jgi:hypothetical protein
MDDLKIVSPPLPAPADEAIAWARQAGHASGSAGSPPVPSGWCAIYSKAWTEGWREGNARRKPSGWSAMQIDYEWKDRDVRRASS